MEKRYRTYTDEELMPLLRSKKETAEQAFSEFYHRYYIKINTYCSRMVNDREQAKDIYQETFIRFFNTVGDSEKITNVSAFLYRIARNLCLNYIRDKKPSISFEDAEFQLKDYQHYETTELFDLVTTALELLDDIYKDAFIMRKFNNLSLGEIAEIAGITIEGARKRIQRATEKIIEMLDPYIKDLSK